MKTSRYDKPVFLGNAHRTQLLATLLPALWGCTSHPLQELPPHPGIESIAEITVNPIRHLDLLFMIDNSPSMLPKQDKMKKQFPRLIDALKDTGDQTLPDLRIAILDSDLGSGNSGVSPRCTTGPFGDKGIFQMRDAATCQVHSEARWLEFTKGKPVNFTGDVSQVFGCLASNVGVEGCGYEHQLAAIEWAFYLPDNSKQWDFLRPEAYLGIVILTDEDDCSAPHNSRMFQANTPNESASLRCATRGHRCDNVTLPYPTQATLSVPYESCHARTDPTCDEANTDTSNPTDCNPLLDVKRLAKQIKALKGDGPEAENMLLVAAIYGTPLAGDTTKSVYKIEKIPHPNPKSTIPEIFEYTPICYDPDHPPKGPGYDPDAAGHGAMGGLRIDALLSEFSPTSRRAYSICERDFGPAMTGIGKALKEKMENLCVPYKLADKSPKPGLQADCWVSYRKRTNGTDKNGRPSIVWVEDKKSLPPCDSSRTPDCWEVKLGNPNGTDDEKKTAELCKPTEKAPSQMVNIVRSKDSDLPDGSRAVLRCESCPVPTPGLEPNPECVY